MSSDLAFKGRQLAKKGVYVQLLTSLILIVIVSLINAEYTIAVTFGCLSFLLPHGFFAYWSFRYAGATKKKLVVQSFNQGLKVKLMLTIILFVIAFSQFNAHPLPLIGAYVIITVSQWAAMFHLRQMS
ncbi:ATP synthase subunit I [Glaciecola sp. KUL10]|uniref:ATP synthase subunit I n=1 Tax=Glaciecola sp. (strain KUL10) TaxID=2161813 RepID=UPI000D78633F|nr:ATP synthase subunit I [Glaciecola sp. KUL10]GBL06141.1 F1-F0-type proton-ATPase [Glaciecola sp. KUL10]